MTLLRNVLCTAPTCWPGCVARVMSGPHKDRIITCTELDTELLMPAWKYEPPILFTDDGVARGSMVSFFDGVLQPLSLPSKDDL